MNDAHLQLSFVLEACGRLLNTPGAGEKLATLPVCATQPVTHDYVWMAVPEWAADLVPDGKKGLFVPKQEGCSSWKTYNWWAGAYTMLRADSERDIEHKNGPIHSYAFKLGEEIQPAFDHAWVNRIILFLRRWWAIKNEKSETEHFGPVPKAELYLTHDVDAVTKTLAIRAKQTVFNLYNRRYKSSLRFLLGHADYWQFPEIVDLERQFGHRSIWNFYGGPGGLNRSPKAQLMDPSYFIGTKKMAQLVRELAADGHRIGLHPQFDSWRNAGQMRMEKSRIQDALGQDIDMVRQHWLRFSFEQTWKAQKGAGLRHDMTLGFNDRPGFRNGAALTFIEPESGMRITPMALMDSHLHDYSTGNETRRFATIDRLLDELVATGGEASVIWHQRVFHKDYGWKSTYRYLLEAMAKRGIGSKVK